MSANPYAPPKSLVQDATRKDAPALWNPGAAASWSLLFSPAFGAFLHMKNWQALGEPGKASAAKGWMIATLGFLAVFSVLGGLMPDSQILASAPKSLGLILLLSWYFSSARGQMKHVQDQFGKTYPRKGWGKPLLWAMLLSAVFFAFVFVIAFIGARLAGKG